MKQLFDRSFLIIEKALDLRVRRNTVLAANIANVDTPGFKAKDIPFREVMAKYIDSAPCPFSLKRTHQDHLDQHGNRINGDTVRSQDQDNIDIPIIVSKERGTPNNVDIDVEMAKLASNNLQYQAAVQALIKEIELLRTAITEGGRA